MAGVPGGTGLKNGSEIRWRKSGDGAVSVKLNVLPRTRMPEMCPRLPRSYAGTPTRSRRKGAPGRTEPSFGDSARSTESLITSAVIGAFDGGEKRRLRLIRNV